MASILCMISALAASSAFICCPIFRIYPIEVSICFITLATLCSVLAIYSFCRSITSWVCAMVPTTRSEFFRRVLTISSILPLAALDCSASFWICDATTAKPLPASPARAASILAFSDNRFVSSAICEINRDASRMLCAELFVCAVCSTICATASFTSALMPRRPLIVTAVLSLASFMLSALLSRLSASRPVFKIRSPISRTFWEALPTSSACLFAPSVIVSIA